MTTFTTSGTAIHQWPANLRPTDVTLHLGANTSSFTSPYTRTVQTTELPGALFDLAATFPPLTADVATAYRAFLAKLRGGAGRFVFPAYVCRYQPPAMYAAERTTIIPLSADSDTITADSTRFTADATTVRYESAFTVTSCPDAVTINGTLWLNSNRHPLQEGGYISWDDASGWRHLHVVVAMTHNRDTLATVLTVEPPMRALPTVSTPMHVHAPSGVFRLTDDGQGALSYSGKRASVSIAAQQARPVTVSVPT